MRWDGIFGRFFADAAMRAVAWTSNCDNGLTTVDIERGGEKPAPSIL